VVEQNGVMNERLLRCDGLSKVFGNHAAFLRALVSGTVLQFQEKSNRTQGGVVFVARDIKLVEVGHPLYAEHSVWGRGTIV
jgi:hypothetical protein